MAFIRRSLGSGGSSIATNPSLTTVFTLEDHETLLIFIAHTPATSISATWNSVALTQRIELAHPSANIQGSIWTLEDASNASSPITITFGSTPSTFAYTAWAVLADHYPAIFDQGSSYSGVMPSNGTTGTTGTLDYSGELAMAMIAWVPGALGSVTPGNDFTAGTYVTSGGGGNAVYLKDAWFQNELGTTGVEATWTDVKSPWVAMLIMLEEVPPEIQDSEVISNLEYAGGAVQDSHVISLLEYHRVDARTIESQVVSVLEYHKGADEPMVIVSQVVSILEYHIAVDSGGGGGGSGEGGGNGGGGNGGESIPEDECYPIYYPTPVV